MTIIVTTFQEFLRRLTERGLEIFGLYYSVYRGSVVDNADPECMGRLKVSVPSVYGQEVPEYWAYPSGMAAAGVNSGFFDIPEPGDPVYVEFEMGRTQYPIWSPGWWGAKSGENEVPWNARVCPPKIMTWRQKNGDRIEFDCRVGKERILIIDKNGSYIDIDIPRQIIGIMAKDNRKDQTEKDKICYTEKDSSEHVGGDKLKEINGNEKISITGNHEETILGSNKSFIGINRETTITGFDKKSILGNEETIIAGRKNDNIVSGWTVNVGQQGITILSVGDIALRSVSGNVYIDGLEVFINSNLSTPSIVPPIPPVPPIPLSPIDKPLHEEKV